LKTELILTVITCRRNESSFWNHFDKKREIRKETGQNLNRKEEERSAQETRGHVEGSCGMKNSLEENAKNKILHREAAR